MHRYPKSTLAARIAAVLALAAALLVSPTGARAWAGGDHHHRQLQAGVTELHGLGITGVQGATRDHGRFRTARAGTGNLDTGSPVPYNGHFRIGSNTKSFASVVALQLVGEGRLRLGDTVERWLPGLVAGNGNDGRRITVRQLLQHTSGLYNYTNDLPGFASAEGFLAHRYDHHEPAELVAMAMRHQPGFAPGTSWDYSNTNYILIGMIIERVTGDSWANQVRQRITGPLGLRGTSSPGDQARLPRPHARGYQQYVEDGPLLDTTEFNTTAAYAAGDLVSTPADLTRFWQALQDGRLLAPAQLAEMRRTVPAVTFQDFMPGSRYGLGVMWLPSDCGGYWSHGGDVPGMSTGNGATDRGDRTVVFSLTTQLAGDEPSLRVAQRTQSLVGELLCAGR